MIGGDPIAWGDIADEGEEVLYLPVSRITSGGIFRQPAQVPTVELGINWDDGEIIEWDDGTPILWD